MAKGDRFFFSPTSTVYDRPEEHGLRYESVEFVTSDNIRLHGWFFAGGDRPRGTVVHCHGNAGNITGHYRFVAWLCRRGFNVLCFDYRGFGRSDGHPTREGAVRDVHAAIDHASQRSDVDADRVVLFGQSIGGTLGLVAAAEREDLSGLAVEGAFASFPGEAYDVCRGQWWLWGVAGLVRRWLIAPGSDPIDCVDRLPPIPKLFICGTADRIVAHTQTTALHERATDPKELWVIQNGHHTDALIDNEPDDDNPARSRRDRFEDFLLSTLDGDTA